MSGGKANLLKTLSDNERKVMGLIMPSNGLKRNELERKTGLAKSSLASTLSQLEKKKLITVRKETNVHFVEPSDWFKGL